MVTGPIRPPRWVVENKSGSVSRFKWGRSQAHNSTNLSNSCTGVQTCASEASPTDRSATTWPFSLSIVNLWNVRISQRVKVTLATVPRCTKSYDHRTGVQIGVEQL